MGLSAASCIARPQRILVAEDNPINQTVIARTLEKEIGLEREARAGSTFAFTARFARAHLAPSFPSAVPDGAAASCIARPQRILVAEDNPINQTVIARTLEKAGHQVALAQNGREALEIWAASRFDVIFMDVQMPEMDGLEATQEIRRREQDPGERICVMAMTANAMSGDRERCLSTGMDGYFTKPMHAQEVLDWLARRETVPGSRSEEHTSELQSLRHLVCRLLLEKTITSLTYLWQEFSYYIHAYKTE